MSDWSWEYDPSPEERVGNLPGVLQREVAVLAQRLVDAASAQYLGDPPPEDSGVSGVKTFADGPWMIWYLTHRRLRKVLIVQVQHAG